MMRRFSCQGTMGFLEKPVDLECPDRQDKEGPGASLLVKEFAAFLTPSIRSDDTDAVAVAAKTAVFPVEVQCAFILIVLHRCSQLLDSADKNKKKDQAYL